MRHDFQARIPGVANTIKFYIGDVRSKSTQKYAGSGFEAGPKLRIISHGKQTDAKIRSLRRQS